MSNRLAIAAAASLLALPAAALGRGPSQAQIRAAVRHAERSRDLWATVNICNTRHHRHVIGIRGQMPSLGFGAALRMRVQIDYWSQSQHRFLPDPGVEQAIWLGRWSYGVHQGGVMYTFLPSVVLRGRIRFEWRLAGKPIGSAERVTASGRPHVDRGDPPGYSAAICRIKR